MRWFGYVERRINDDIVKKIDAIRIKGSRERCNRKNKLMEVIGGDMGVRKVDKNIVMVLEEWGKIIRVANLIYVV